MLKYFAILLVPTLLLDSLTLTDCSTNELYEEDARILNKCLADKMSEKYTMSDLQKISVFGSWKHAEEVPCFTRCLSINKGWFDEAASKWIKQKIEAELGPEIYSYCKFELEQSYENVCDFVHKGFRCLKQAEENVPKTYTTFLNCAIELHAGMEQLQQYSAFPKTEHIPCLFKCFADKMNFYGADYAWNFENWIKAFGPLETDATKYSQCQANEVDRQVEGDARCAWMYKEYLCLEQFTNKDKIETTTNANEIVQVSLAETNPEDLSEIIADTNSTTMEIFTTDEHMEKNVTVANANSILEKSREKTEAK